MFGDDYEVLENCGVEFDHTCLNEKDNLVPGLDHEELGECEEGDEDCVSRYGLYNRKKSLARSQKRATLKDGKLDVDNLPRLSNQTKTAAITQMNAYSQPNFEGLPKDYFKKHYKPDYPTDLQMKQVCAAKPFRRRTLGVTRTQPRAVFIPSSRTTLDSQEWKSLPASPATASTGKKEALSQMNTLGRSKTESEHAILLEEPSPLEQNRLPPAIVSSSDEVVVDWLETHNIQMMFEYFLGLCVINQPENPWTYISNLCEKMIEARNNFTAFDNLPRILTPEHTEAIFRIYDRIENGYITVPQYKSAMDAMGLNRFNTNPDGCEENAITKDTFVKEATDAIDNLLRTFMVFEQTEEAGVTIPDTQKTEINPKKSVSSGSGSGSLTSSSNTNYGSGSAESAVNSPVQSPIMNEPPLLL